MLFQPLTEIVGKSFEAQGLDKALGRVTAADRPDLADVQCNGALQAAKASGRKPRDVAEAVVAALKEHTDVFAEISIAGPGFINFKLSPAFLQSKLTAQNTHKKLGFDEPKKEKIVIDFCGPNIGKALHVGHIRSTMIGDSIRRMHIFAGHDVVGDIHMGDWGLPMGIIIYEVMQEQPDLSYFKEGFTGPFPSEPPFSLGDLARLYPQGAARTKENEEERKKVRIITAKMQDGHPGYRALWKHIINVSTADIRSKTDELGVHFDLWYGESDSDPYVRPMIEDLKARKIAFMDDGALIVPVKKNEDKYEVPPVILVKSDGGVGYHTTDIATIIQRDKDFKPDHIVYVIDKRQQLHMEQVFRTARRADYAPQAQFHFAGFGTMNGKDGKPFKTRDGGVPDLHGFMAMMVEKAADRLREIELDKRFSAEEFAELSKRIGYGAMKFGDLMNSPQSDYIFDIDKFVSFEGKTGPYLQYAVVRLSALLEKAKAQNFVAGDFVIDAAQHSLALALLRFPVAVENALSSYAPNALADYLFGLGQEINRFYQTVPVLIEPDAAKRGAALALLGLSARILTQGLDLLGIKIPAQM
jgi:arginyl-tRNA synthetase